MLETTLIRAVREGLSKEETFPDLVPIKHLELCIK